MAAGMKTWIKGLLLGSALTLSACNMYKLEELRHTTPQGSPFQSQLSKLYMDYAEAAEKHFDWDNSWHFADKGLMAAYGKDVPPEDPNDWNLPADARPQIERAHAELMAVLTPDVMQVAPARAAEAQFYFDCWVKEQEQNWRDDEIANCRDNLDKALNDLSAPGSRHVKASKELPKPMTSRHHHKPKPIGEEKPGEALPATDTADYYKEQLATTPKPKIVTDEPKPEAKTEAKQVKTALKEPVKESAKEVPKEVKETKETKEVKVTKETKEPKAAKTVKETKTTKETKETKDVKEIKDSKESKDIGSHDAMPESTSYAVFFEPDRAEVSEPGMNVITEVIKSLQGVSDYVVILHSSKDHPGKAAERIQVVKKLLVAGGIKDGSIRNASGKVEVESGKLASRRVEIFLNE